MDQKNQFKWALLDIETTGGRVTRDKITEIAVIILTEDGVSTTWESLMNPGCSIPGYITALTDISNATVADAPSFSDISQELYDLLEGCVFIAHNARFDCVPSI